MIIYAKFPDMLHLRICTDGKLQVLFKCFIYPQSHSLRGYDGVKNISGLVLFIVCFLSKVPIQLRSSSHLLNLKVHKSGSPQENKLSSALWSFEGEEIEKYFIACLKLKIKAVQPLCVGIIIVQDCYNLSEL